MDIWAISNQKGGVGKTTTAAALAQAAVIDGKRVLCVDCDPQSNLTFALNGSTSTAGLYELLLEPQMIDKIIYTTSQGMDLIAGSWSLSTLTAEAGSAHKLTDALKPIRSRYDLIVIDTPPTAGILQYMALTAATGLIIPVEADIYALTSLSSMADAAELIKKNNPKLSIIGVLITNYDGRSTHSKQMAQAIINECPKVRTECLGGIRAGIAIREAVTMQESLFDYAPKSKPAADYMNLYKYLMGQD